MKTLPPSDSRPNRVMLGSAALILLAIVGLSYGEWRQYSRVNEEVARATAIRDSVDTLLANPVDAETGQRGFLLTGEERYLEPYNHAVEAVPGNLARLNRMLAMRGGESGNVTRLSSLVGQKLDELRQTIELRRIRGAQSALALVLSDKGRVFMDEIRALSAEIKDRENSNQNQASSKGEGAAQSALLATVAGSLVLLFLFAFGLEPFARSDARLGKRPWPLRYGAAILAVVAAIVLRLALTPLIGSTALVFTLFFPAVLFVAWFGGFRAGALSIALSALAANYYFAEPTGSFRIVNRQDQVELLIFVLVGFGMALLAHAQSQAVERAVVAEGAERSERQRFETTLASIGDAVIATDRAGRITFVNKVARTLLRAPEAALLGRHLDDVFQIVNELTRGKVESPIAKVLREGGVVGLANHTVLIAQDGTEIPIDDSGAAVRTEGGPILGAVLVFRDITERRRTETARRLLASIVESSDDAIISKDLNGVVTSWNKGAEHIFGYAAEEIIGRPISLLAAPDHVDELPKILERIRGGEIVDHFKTVRKTKSGKLIHASVTVSPIRDATGQITGASKILRDITAQVEAAAEVAEQRERLRVTLNSIGDAVMATDTAGRVTYLNPVAEGLTGWTSEDATGRVLDEVFRIVMERSRQTVENPVARVIREGRVVGLANHTILISRQGREIGIDDSAAPILNAKNELIGVVLVFRDVSDKRAAEEEVRVRAEELSTLVDVTPALIWFAHDADCRRITGNRSANKLVGVGAGTNVSQTPLDAEPVPFKHFLADGSEIPLRELPLQRAIATGQIVSDVEFEFRLSDSRRVQLYGNAAPLFDAQGKVRGAVAAFLDITDRKRAQEALRQRMHLLEPIHCFVRDLDDRIVYWNPGAVDLYGFSADEAVGQVSHALLKTVFPAPLEQILLEVRSAERWDGELLHTRRDGSQVTVASHWELHRDESGEPAAILEINVDVTDRKRAGEALRHSQLSAELLRIQDEERRRIGRELHDSAGQNLILLKIHLDLLASSASPGEAMREKLAECIRLANELIKEIRTTAFALYPPTLEDGGLKSAIPSYLDGFKERSGLTVNFEISPEFVRLPREMELAIFRVLQESLTNVFRHSGSPTANIWLDVKDGTIRLEIADQGKGMPPEVLQSFNRESLGDVGVGLRGMKERIRQLGGQLNVSSSPGGTIVSAAVALGTTS